MSDGKQALSQDLVTVLGVSCYQFQDEKSGRNVEGTTVHYYSHEKNNDPNNVDLGFKPVKATLPLQAYESFLGKSFPFDAEIDYSLTVRRGKPDIKINGFKEI